ncbi:MAG: hypothetical protein I3273_04120 [Candidatus Moeniiplasma glomeromycotorum]|nr:hypothetical protein [Candidatus Moeniiplasma glomeromycotorum]
MNNISINNIEIYKRILNDIWFFKLNPSILFFNGVEIVMYPNNETTFILSQDFNFDTFELFLKKHLEVNHNEKSKYAPTCFPKNCWKLKENPKWMEEWLNAPSFKIDTNTKIGVSSEPFSKSLLKNFESKLNKKEI